MHELSRDHRVPTREEYFERWRVLHNAGDVDPQTNIALRVFLATVYILARPLAKRRVAPNVVTALGIVQGLMALACAYVFGPLAALVVIASSITDGIDGCVAALTDRTTSRGALFDSIADRITEWCFVGAVVVVGARPVFGVGAAAAIILFEYTRARLLALDVRDIGLVTVGERPTRVIACAVGCVGSLARSTIISEASLVVIVATSIIGLAQLLRFARRSLDN